MKRIAVYVATTGGPVRIERITPERAPHSMVCLGRSSTILPISGDYDDFLRPGSGVIEREFGPFDESSFRLDVSDTIGAGLSWQLGVFVTHAINASADHELAGIEDTIDSAAIITGRVNYDLEVDSVDHISEKLTALKDIALDLKDCPVQLIVPHGENHVMAKAEALPGGLTLIAARTVWDACQAVGLGFSDPKPPVPQTHRTPAQKKRSHSTLMGFAGLVAVGALFATYALSGLELPAWARGIVATFSDDLRQAERSAESVKPVPPRPEFVPATLRILAQRTPAGQTCADLQFGNVEPVLDPLVRDGRGRVADSPRDAICGLAFEVSAEGAPRYVALVLDIRSGKSVRGKLPPAELRGEAPLSGASSWVIVLPRQSDAPFAYQLVLVESERPFAAETIREIQSRNIAKLTRDGFATQLITHRVMP